MKTLYKILLPVAALVILVIAGYFIYPKINKQAQEPEETFFIAGNLLEVGDGQIKVDAQVFSVKDKTQTKIDHASEFTLPITQTASIKRIVLDFPDDMSKAVDTSKLAKTETMVNLNDMKQDRAKITVGIGIEIKAKKGSGNQEFRVEQIEYRFPDFALK